MIVVQRGVVDITPEYNRALRPVFCVSEGDKTSRQIVITVMQNGEAFLIPSGSTVYIIGKKPDNNIFTYRCSHSGSDVTFNITEQMSAASGIVLCELQINLSGEVLGSANFVYWTESTPLENGSYSESDLNIFLEAIAGAERLDNFYAGIEDMVAQAVEQIQIMPGQVVIDPTLLVSGAAADAKATGDIVRAFMNALITETTEESIIATCDDAAGGLPLKTLTANIVPAQAGSGDPSPDNVRAISGYTGVTVTRTGKNLITNNMQSVTKNGITMTRNTDGSFTFNGTATASIGFYISAANSSTQTVLPIKPGTYTLSGGASGGTGTTFRLAVYIYVNGTYTRAYSDFGSSRTFTISENENGYIPLINIYNGTTVSNLTFKPQLEIGDTATEYEPYNGATYPVTFPTSAGTVYGGTLVVYADGSGTLTVDRAEIASYAGETLPGEWISDRDVYSAGATPTTGAQVVYKVATPTTYALSAVQVAQMLQGVNNVWLNAAGTLAAEYYASTGLYVEKRVNAQRNMIAGVEEAMTATQNYAVGDLLIVGNTLYKVTAAISSGAALVVGTNVTETTVAEQLLALA